MEQGYPNAKSIAEFATATGLAGFSCRSLAKRAANALWRDGDYLDLIVIKTKLTNVTC
jgi:hypothetical protein